MNKRVPVIAGTGSNCTDTASYLTKQAQNAGADAALVVTPYYNEATQNGLIAHYTDIAKHTDLPIILYNVPSKGYVKSHFPKSSKKMQITSLV